MKPIVNPSFNKALAPSVLQFFSDLNAETVKVIDENHRLIRYSFKRKISQDFGQFMETSQLPQLKDQRDVDDFNDAEHLMLVSYQVAGLNQDRASISLFEFDPTDNSINPANFIVIS
jgi:hypothetical protein